MIGHRGDTGHLPTMHRLPGEMNAPSEPGLTYFSQKHFQGPIYPVFFQGRKFFPCFSLLFPGIPGITRKKKINKTRRNVN